MRTLGTRHTAEDVEDLAHWLRSLTGCPSITQTLHARCPDRAHGDDSATWFYVEADAETGVARLRCLAGGHVHTVLDSTERWTFPGVWSCTSCSQSIAEVVYGIHDDAGTADWLVVGVRCVECGDVYGVTDMLLPGLPLDELLAAL